MMFPDIGEFSNTDVSKDEGETVKITSEVKLNRRRAIRQKCHYIWLAMWYGLSACMDMCLHVVKLLPSRGID